MINRNSKIFLQLILLFFIFIFEFLILTTCVNADGATLYLFPSTGYYDIGSNFSIQVRINSGGELINAAEGSLTFNPKELNVISISKSGSIFSLWTKEPVFSNSTGTIEFGGGTPTNFSGVAGNIIIITFEAKKNIITNVGFVSGAVLAADKKGTNVLSKMDGGSYTLRPLVDIPAGKGIVTTPIIYSSTHPDYDKWYSNNDPEFNWVLSSDITGVSFLLDENPTANPGSISDGSIESKRFEDVEDGVWYFHIRFKDQYGWGEIIHRKVLIDTEPPESFKVTSDNGGDPTNPSPVLNFNTTDSLSGVEDYEIEIDGKSSFIVTPDFLENSVYKIPPQKPGEHTIIIRAFDAARNERTATTSITIKKPPLITYPTIIIILIILMIWAVATIFYIRHKNSLWQKRVRKETREAAESVFKGFRILRDKTEEQIEIFDNNPGLTEAEKKIRDKLKEALDTSEEAISKEIKDIEKELE